VLLVHRSLVRIDDADLPPRRSPHTGPLTAFVLGLQARPRVRRDNRNLQDQAILPAAREIRGHSPETRRVSDLQPVGLTRPPYTALPADLDDPVHQIAHIGVTA